MSKRITENELLLPALYVIHLNKKANTTKIKEVLTNIMLGKDELLTKINEFKDITNKIIQREEE